MNQGPSDPHAPESNPARQGRRLVQMLFRSGVEVSKAQHLVTNATRESDIRSEDTSPWTANSAQQKTLDPQPLLPTSKFSALKRKLFPSQNRRHPRRVPPLVSPISAPEESSLPCLEEGQDSSKQKSAFESDEVNSFPERQTNNNSSIDSSRSDWPHVQQPELLSPHEDTPESDLMLANGKNDDRTVSNNWKPGSGRALIDDDDDRDLESAVEALDFESSIADTTLEEMNKAIDELRVWKETREQKTQQALRDLENAKQESLLVGGSGQVNDAEIECEDSLETQIERKLQQQQRDREAQTLELRKEAETYQQECILYRTTLDESDAIRVAQSLQVQENEDSGDAALFRLRDELFQLDVKRRQESLLQGLQEAENDLDLNFVDVQAFTSELDAILAQFDDPAIAEANSLTPVQ